MAALDDYFRAMVDQKASDFHLTSGTFPNFRISGTMMPVSDQVLTEEDARVSAVPAPLAKRAEGSEAA